MQDETVELRSEQIYCTKGIFMYSEVKALVWTFTLLLAKSEAYSKHYLIQTTNSIQNDFKGLQKKRTFISLYISQSHQMDFDKANPEFLIVS